jgi:hypothetical protein
MTAMTDRIDDFLNGNIDRTDLTAPEQQQAAAARRASHEARACIGAREAPDVTSAVMTRVESLGAPGSAVPRGVKRWLAAFWTPREVSFRVRPAYGVAAAAAIVVVASLVAARTGSPPQVAATSGDPHLFVQFRLQNPDAMDVRLAGTFTNWEPRYELHEASPGVWTITLPLSPGVHDYVFVVNGRQWVADPHAPQVDDGFGGTNSRIALLIPDASRS